MAFSSFTRYATALVTVPLLAGVLCAQAWAPPRFADLRVTIAATPAAPSAGQVVAFAVGVHNAGPDSALDTMLDLRVEGGELVRAVATQGRCSAERCALGLMGYRNAAHDARATVRVLVRTGDSGAVSLAAAASSESLAMEITPENTSARREVTVSPALDARPAADVALALVALTKRVATYRVTNHGPDAAEAVVAAGARVGRLAAGEERSLRIRYAKPGRAVATVRSATRDPTPGNDRVAVRVR
jgi:hypothetical protein